MTFMLCDKHRITHLPGTPCPKCFLDTGIVTKAKHYPELSQDEHGRSYAIKTYCPNCEDHDQCYLPKGTLKKDCQVECRKCGCQITL